MASTSCWELNLSSFIPKRNGKQLRFDYVDWLFENSKGSEALKISFLLGALLLAPVVCRADSSPFDEVSRDHWSVAAIEQLSRWRGEKIILKDVFAQQPITRYAMAVMTVRGLDKFGYNPVSKDSIDGLAVRDVLAALVFEYGEEIHRLSVRDPMTSGSIEIDNYQADKEAHRHLNSSEWYIRFQEHPWTNIKHKYKSRSSLENRVTPPPRLAWTPAMLQAAAEKARIAREEAQKKMWPQLPTGE